MQVASGASAPHMAVEDAKSTDISTIRSFFEIPWLDFRLGKKSAQARNKGYQLAEHRLKGMGWKRNIGSPPSQFDAIPSNAYHGRSA